MLLPPPVLQWFQPSCQAKVTQFQFHVLIDEEVTWQTKKFQLVHLWQGRNAFATGAESYFCSEPEASQDLFFFFLIRNA